MDWVEALGIESIRENSMAGDAWCEEALKFLEANWNTKVLCLSATQHAFLLKICAYVRDVY
jgi:hypothetical protein